MAKRNVPYEEMSESGKQFSDIWDERNDPEKREERQMKKNREKRAEQIAQDMGI